MRAPPRPATAVPWVVGQWVSGERFYGREREIAALGTAPGDGAGRRWVAGLRRIGKTSLLRQLERLALDGAAAGAAPVLPIYWDLEGADDPGELALSLDDALLDAGEGFARLGLDPPAPGGGDAAAVLERLGAALAGRGSELLLLCDEADRLAALAASHPGLVRRLWRAAAGAGRVVIASSVRLADLAAGGAGPGGERGAAEAVEGFGEPLLLGVMAPAEARELVRQTRLPEAARPAFDDVTVESIRATCGDHPMLLQLAGRRCHEAGDAGAALRGLAAERTIEHLFEVDFELLTGAERRALRAIAAAEHGGGPGPGAPEEPAPRRLLALGLLRPASRGPAIRNRLLAAWLLRRA